MAFVPSLNSSAEAAVAVSDEVVPTSSGNQGDGSISTVHYKANEAGYTDIFLSPNLEESEVRAAEDAVNEREGNEKDKGVQRPHGYNDGVKPGVQVLKVIPPGGELLFSLPITHVSKQWHIEVPFRFALEHPEKARQPYSYVAFFWDDLPEEYRSMGSQPAPAKPNPSEGTILHESGHPGPPKQP
jgi:hypothetical protein